MFKDKFASFKSSGLIEAIMSDHSNAKELYDWFCNHIKTMDKALEDNLSK